MSTKEKPLKPFTLDLGAATISVEAGELHDEACGLALFPDRKIIIDVQRTGGQRITSTLLHECLHHLDDLFMAQWLTKKHHKRLDIIANVIDMLFSRNWDVMKALYEAKHED